MAEHGRHDDHRPIIAVGIITVSDSSFARRARRPRRPGHPRGDAGGRRRDRQVRHRAGRGRPDRRADPPDGRRAPPGPGPDDRRDRPRGPRRDPPGDPRLPRLRGARHRRGDARRQPDQDPGRDDLAGRRRRARQDAGRQPARAARRASASAWRCCCRPCPTPSTCCAARPATTSARRQHNPRPFAAPASRGFPSWLPPPRRGRLGRGSVTTAAAAPGARRAPPASPPAAPAAPPPYTTAPATIASGALQAPSSQTGTAMIAAARAGRQATPSTASDPTSRGR